MKLLHINAKTILTLSVCLCSFIAIVIMLPVALSKEYIATYELQPNQIAGVHCNGLSLQYKWIDWNKTTRKGTQLEVSCNGQPVITPSPIVTITPTAAPTPTSTPSPTPTGMIHPTSMPPVTTSSLPVPLCPNHDSTKWHPLVLRNSDGTVKCTYGHEHHDDPNRLNDVFGPVSAYTSGQEISYPWQTSSTAGEENHAKHEFYKWNVVTFKDMGNKCTPSNAPLGFKNIRAEYHQDAIHGALVRFHSYWLEAQGCDPKDSSYSGILRIGGHMDYGRLSLSDGSGEEHYLTLASDPTGYSDDRRIHMGLVNGVVPCCMNTSYTWYGSNRYVNQISGPKISVRNGIFAEDWGAMNSKDLVPVYNFKYWFGDSSSGGNNSWQEPVHLLGLTVPKELDAKDGKVDGYVTFKGFTNRYGDILPSSCSPVGADCVPISVEGMKVGSYEFRAASNNVKERDYDVLVGGKSTIGFPN